MPRIDPRYPPLWQDGDTLQLGVTAVVVIRRPTLWQLRTLDHLYEGIDQETEARLSLLVGAQASTVRQFLQELGPVLVSEDDRPAVTLEATSTPDADALTAALDDAGMNVMRAPWHNTSAFPLDAQSPVIVLAHHLVDPRRIARLMREDTVHLPVVFELDGVSVGPLIIPGQTPCLACHYAHRTDSDKNWPMLASQLLFAEPPAISPAMVVTSANLAVKLLSESATLGTETHSVKVHAGVMKQTWHAHRPHQDCLCQSLQETVKDVARGVLHLEPRSQRVFARPA